MCTRVCTSMNVVCIFVVFASLCSLGQNEEPLKVISFNVKPGGQPQSFEQSWEGVTCTFAYACQGGTGEQWNMVFSKTSDKGFMSCAVERPSRTSYLFFEKFNLNISGGKVTKVEAFKNDNVPLKPGEFEVKGNEVKHAEGKFESQLTRVAIHAVGGKSEL